MAWPPPRDGEGLSAESLIRLAAETFGPTLALTCSWQKQSSVLVQASEKVECGRTLSHKARYQICPAFSHA